LRRQECGVTLVVTQLIGGLGNQFFQYAAARALALRHGATLKLDTRRFSDYWLRRYELDKYPLCATVATDDALRPFGIDLGSGQTSPQPGLSMMPFRPSACSGTGAQIATFGIYPTSSGVS
jgi:hypothetical protein